jgi:hypothetical protein
MVLTPSLEEKLLLQNSTLEQTLVNNLYLVESYCLTILKAESIFKSQPSPALSIWIWDYKILGNKNRINHSDFTLINMKPF